MKPCITHHLERFVLATERHGAEATHFIRKILITGDVTASKLRAIPLLDNTITRHVYDVITTGPAGGWRIKW